MAQESSFLKHYRLFPLGLFTPGIDILLRRMEEQDKLELEKRKQNEEMGANNISPPAESREEVRIDNNDTSMNLPGSSNSLNRETYKINPINSENSGPSNINPPGSLRVVQGNQSSIGQGSFKLPNPPVSARKHLCSICGEQTSGKNYGAHSSCSACKGFFKRTLRNNSRYVCKKQKSCVINKKQRNACQYCRYQKCLAIGMIRQNVQERQSVTEREQMVAQSPRTGEGDAERINGSHSNVPAEKMMDVNEGAGDKFEQPENDENILIATNT